MSVYLVLATIVAFALLTAAYIAGARYVGKHSPQHLITFHFIMVAVRFLFAVTAVGVFMLFADSRTDTLHYAALVIALYLVMMTATLIKKH